MIVAIVQIPIEKRSNEDALTAARQSAPRFAALGDRGLLKKYYLNGDAGGGGVYIWNSRAEAEAVFNDDWRRNMEEAFGVEPTITWYDSMLQVDNARGEILESTR